MAGSHGPFSYNTHSHQPASNIVGTQVQINFPNQGDPTNARCPTGLRAITWPEGKRIDLTWVNSSGVTRVVIKRSKTFHSAFLTDEAEVIYNGPAVEHFIDGVPVAETVGKPGDLYQSPPDLEVGVPSTGVDLDEDAFYYYTVYSTVAEDPIGILDFGLEAKERCQVTGLSITDYLRTEPEKRGRGEYLYQRFSQATRDRDAQQAAAEGRATGYLQDYARFVQGGISLLRGYTKALEKVGDPSLAPAGLVGSAFDQATILQNWVRRFGIIPERRILDVAILRRMAEGMVFIYKEKGSCRSIVDFTKLLTLWDSSCAEVGTGGSCNPFFLKTWDGLSQKVSLGFASSLVTAAAGSLVLPGAFMIPDAHNGSLFLSAMGDVFQVESNTADTITFVDTSAVPNFEDLLNISAVAPVSGTLYDLTVTRTAGGPLALNDGEYDEMVLLDSANTLMSVVGTTNPGTVRVDSSLLPVTGAGAVAPGFLLGANFAARNPQFNFQIRTRCPTFIYEPLKDLDLKGDPDFDPFDVLWGGGSLFGTPFLAGDVILTIAAGVADAVGQATTVSGNVLTDTSANFGPVNSLSQYGLNPNRNQTALFRVIANTATTLTVESPVPGVTLETVAQAGSNYFLLDLPKSRKYEILVRLIKLMLPTGRRIFIFFA